MHGLLCTGVSMALGTLLLACTDPRPGTGREVAEAIAMRQDAAPEGRNRAKKDADAGGDAGEGAQETPATQSGSPRDSRIGPDAPLEPVPLPDDGLLPVADPVTGADVKLDGVLLELVRARRSGGDAAVLAYIEQHRPGLSVERLQVEIICESVDTAEAVRNQVTGAGGTVTSSFENRVWAEIALEDVEALAVTEAVWTVSMSQALAPIAR